MSKINRQLTERLRQHLNGKRIAVPEGGRLAWGWFIDLCRTRTSNGFGPNPISFAEMEAYARLHRWPLEPRHVDMVMALDCVWLEFARAGLGTSGPDATPRGHGQPCTPEAFDAVFG